MVREWSRAHACCHRALRRQWAAQRALLAPDSPETSCPLLINITQRPHPYVSPECFFPIHVRIGLEALPYGALALRSLSAQPRASGSLQPTQKLLSPTMKGIALCGMSRQTATGMPLTFCQENGTASSAWNGLQAFQIAARTRVGGTRLPDRLLSRFPWAYNVRGVRMMAIRQCFRCWLSNVSWVLNISPFHSFLDRFQKGTVHNSYSCCLSFFLL